MVQEVYGLQRSGKSCRLRYKNHLDPSLKKTPLSADEEVLFAHLQRIHGKKWATIASKLPGR
jgi:myb proto-oncogene protein